MNKTTRLLVVLSSLFLIKACGPTDSNQSNNPPPSSNTGIQYCAENYPSLVSNLGNVYEFETDPQSCLGLVESPSLRKEVSFSINVIEVDSKISKADLNIDGTIKLLLRQSGLLNVSYDIYGSLEMTNNSGEDYCYRPEKVELKDAAGNSLFDLRSSSRTGGALFHNTYDTTFRCLLAGQTHVFIADTPLGSIEGFEDIATASMSRLRIEPEKAGQQKAPTLNAEMMWLNPGKKGSSYPSLIVTWTNTTGAKVTLDDDAHKVWFLDKNNYVVSGTYVRLDEGLDIDKSELKQEDFEILNGETITLSDDAADNAAVYPSSSSRALVYLEWIP